MLSFLRNMRERDVQLMLLAASHQFSWMQALLIKVAVRAVGRRNSELARDHIDRPEAMIQH